MVACFNRDRAACCRQQQGSPPRAPCPLPQAPQQPSPWRFASADTEGVGAWLDSGLRQTGGVARKRDAELALVDRSAAVLVAGEAEAAVLRRYRPNANIHVVPAIREVAAPAQRAQAGGVGAGDAGAAAALGSGLAPRLRSVLGVPPSSCERRAGLLFVGNLHYPPNW